MVSEEPSQKSTTEQKSDGFFPVPDDFLEYVNVSADKFRGNRKVLVSLDFLRQLVGIAAAATCFDEDFYKNSHADLRKAVEDGSISDLKLHFISEGYFEGRSASSASYSSVDEKWYLEKYPDVNEALKAGKIDSATAHYFSTGRTEGRIPSPNVSEEILTLISSMHPR